VRSDGNIDRHFVVHGKLGLSANAATEEDKLYANPTNSAGSTGAHDVVSVLPQLEMEKAFIR
jgi:hypothetical protein